ncbi:MAG: hypothetical protein A3F17_07385 [Gammaproteobacteria bacterium RIFCSPHIGHO2_12_FULL_41_15]|nr:MAG: hypothetical protein A3F17_07385 [Gammaproteobacteria bacterium RIFCSPHIGHO2_12_FULL_41_15]
MMELQLHEYQTPLYPIEEQAAILLVVPAHLGGVFDEVITAVPEAKVTKISDDKEAIFQHIAQHHALIACPRHLFTEELLERAGHSLKWVHNNAAGNEYFLFPRFVNSNIVLTNGRIIQGPECADHAIALLLTLTRGIHRVLRSKNVSKIVARPVELCGKRALVIGAGGIGLLIAERAKSFGMSVTMATPECLPMLSMIERVIRPEAINDLLPHVDVTFMAAPHTYHTHRMMSHSQFSAMKEGAYFINVSRGGTVDTEALTEAARSGKLGGVGIDVSDPEPLDEQHPLRHMENVVITPHMAGWSDKNRERSVAIIRENVQRFVAGMPLLNVVNKTLGY